MSGGIVDLLTDRPQTKRLLAARAGCSTREVEAFIQEERLDGWPILSNSDGYWLSNDPAEIRKCAERLRSRALTQLQTAASLKEAADKLPITLW